MAGACRTVNRREMMRGAAAAAAALAAPSIASAQGRSVLRFVPQADLALLDPVQSTAIVTRNHGMMVYDTLYGLDESLTPRPQMAACHLVESDGLVWSITLRPDQRWHDGTPVLVRDVVAGFERWASCCSATRSREPARAPGRIGGALRGRDGAGLDARNNCGCSASKPRRWT